MTIYDYPKYYEVAFSFRDISAESIFLKKCIEKYSDIPVNKLLEIACGPAPHAGELTNLGYSYTGFDINQKMLDFAQDKWTNLKTPINLINADMTSFAIIDKFEFAFIMLGSLYINSSKELHSHFDSLSQVLEDGGLYFLDWCIQFSDPLIHNKNNSFQIEKDGIKINSNFDIRLIDEKEQMYEEIWSVKIDDDGLKKELEMKELNKAIKPMEFLDFIKSREDFEFVDWWSDWDFDKQIEDTNQVTRPVALVRKVNSKKAANK